MKLFIIASLLFSSSTFTAIFAAVDYQGIALLITAIGAVFTPLLVIYIKWSQDAKLSEQKLVIQDVKATVVEVKAEVVEVKVQSNHMKDQLVKMTELEALSRGREEGRVVAKEEAKTDAQEATVVKKEEKAEARAADSLAAQKAQKSIEVVKADVAVVKEQTK